MVKFTNYGYITGMKKECPSCAMTIDKAAKTCPVCGYEFPRPNRLYQFVAIFLLLLFIIFYLL